MNKLYIAEIEPLTEEALYEKALSLVGEKRREQAEKMRNPSDKARSVAAGLLLRYAVVQNADMRNADGQHTDTQDAGMRDDNMQHAVMSWDGSYHVGEHGKPELPKKYGLHFNLSHSGEYAVCAISDHNIGTDIQIHQGERESLAKRFFHPEELEVLNKAADPVRCFYDLWCLKESYIKYTGRGLGAGLNRFSVVPLYLHKELWIDGICCVGECDPEFIRLDLKELMEHKCHDKVSERAETEPMEGYSLAVVTMV